MSRPRKTAWDLWRRNGLIWAALMVLLLLSLGLAYLPIGKSNTAGGLVIALGKGALVVLLFMELAKQKPLIKLTAASGLVFVVVMFAITLADVLSRLANG